MNRVKRFKNIKENIQKMQLRFRKYVNKKWKEGSQLKENNKVYLLTKNLTTKRFNKKLNYTKVGPFFIKTVKELVNYELSLSKNICIHLIFHINMLESVDLNTFIQKEFHYENSKEKYIVKRILEKKGQSYLIKWKNSSYIDNT